jgi:hypothetical protein
MNKVKAMMKQAHSQSQPLTQSPVQVNIKSQPESPRPATPPAQPPVMTKPTRTQVALPTGVSQIARDDVPVTDYGIKPVATNFNCYNKEVFKWLREFSSNNQFSGGVPVTKSQVIEIALDVLMYDLGINPIGYESQQALREDIQNKIRGIS